MPTKITILDARKFHCAAYDWEVICKRILEFPVVTPTFQTPAEAWEFFSQIKRSYVVEDTNVAGSKDVYPTFEQAWFEYCRTVENYSRAFMQVGVNGTVRKDLPDPKREEPVH